VIAQGVRRFRVIEYLTGFPFLVARIEEIGIAEVMTPDIEARVRLVKGRAQDVIQLLPNVPAEVAATIEQLDSPSALADFIAGILDAKPAEKQDVLDTIDIKERLDKVLALLVQRIEVLKISKQIGDQTQQSLSSSSANIFCASSCATFRRNWGGRREVDRAPRAARSDREGGNAAGGRGPGQERTQAAGAHAGCVPEYGMIRSYLDWLIGLPWSKFDPDAIDIAERAASWTRTTTVCPRSKRRILEYLAVTKLNPNGRSPILCFVGPPGVGKTSLGRASPRRPAANSSG